MPTVDGTSLRPLDPRLLAHARAARPYLLWCVASGMGTAGLLVAQATLIAGAVTSAFLDGADLAALATPMALLAAVALGRALLDGAQEVAGHRAGAAVTTELRARLLDQAMRLGPGWLSAERCGELTALATRGIDALDGYFSRYLPQLVLAVVVPVVVLLTVFGVDPPAAVTIAATLPLVPVFMVLVGLATRQHADRQWRALAVLAGHFLDVVAGLPTLKVFGRARAQAATIRAVTDDHARAALRTLRMAFLSALVLELLSTLSVALVAVGVGLRLVAGSVDLRTALVVLILAPEVYRPLRQVGVHHHACVEGLAAARRVFEVLETAPAPVRGPAAVPDLRMHPMRVEAVTVTYPGAARAALADVSLELDPGETVALVGPSGCGKSTLAALLVGVVRPTGGRITVGGVDAAAFEPDTWRAHVAHLPQRPRLFAGTIADNVRLARPEAPAWAVRAALHTAGAGFVDRLPGGVDTRLGEGGAGLSAGERQRVALARALLPDARLLVLDEPTSGLDAAAEQAVVDGLRVARAGRTILLVTHRPALLALADRVVRLGPVPGAPASPETGVEEPVPEPGRHQGRAAAGEKPTPTAGRARDGREPRPTERPGGRGPAAGFPRRRSAVRRVAEFGRPALRRLALAALCGAVATAAGVGLMATSAWLISRAAQHPPILYLLVAVGAVRAFSLARAGFRYAERLASHDAAFQVLRELRVAMWRRLERVAPAGLPEYRSGDLLARLVADVDAQQDLFLRVAVPYAAAAVAGAGAVALLWWLLPGAGLVLLVALLLTAVAVPWLAARAGRQAEHRVAPLRGQLSDGIVELLGGARDLLACRAAGRRLERVSDIDRTLQRARAAAATSTGLAAGLTTLAAGAAMWVALALGVAAVRSGALDGVVLAVLVLVPLAAVEVVAVLARAPQDLRRVRRSAERVVDVLERPPPVREPPTPVALPGPPHTLRVEGLRVYWPGAATPAVDGLDLDLTPGRRVAVVGPSGSGKSTLVAVLLRFLDPAAGRVTLDGVDVTTLAGDDVRRVLTLCAQDAHVFDTSIGENVLLARRSAGPREVRAALAAARLLDWVDGLPDGSATAVGEHGSRVSGGQRQRIALARALLADRPVLLLDEPTEHLDLATADALAAELLAATAGRTTLLLTHRLAALGEVDEIVVLDGGRVVERGTHARLLAARGPYRRMWDLERDARRFCDPAPPTGGGGEVGALAPARFGPAAP
ncbi:MAG: cydCD [Pseudonocardia sp.]|jgi:ATP-binding cassette subfamily C protein CydCD|uniref:thiol reductant ABC exporter subunit CydD n=1 Tax=Pseudonocardia sp. TaxID=60912 RepID=UPI0026394BCA|nr:thiol reductant ABC exporter subunit CydD [Pseudonocardia sp.]MCU1628683.1 cydCD [Pseudonocardia sp.]